jgi:hypothetical protein
MDTTAMIEPPERSSSGRPARTVLTTPRKVTVGAIKVLGGQFVEGPVGQRGRAGDEDVDAAEPLRRGGDRSLQRGAIGDIGRKDGRRRARRRDGACRGFQAFVAAGDQRQARAVLRQQPRGGQPDAAAGAGENDAPAVE